METYSIELYSGLLTEYNIKLLALPGKSNGKPPSLLSLGLFIAKVTLYCLLYGRKFDRVIFTDTLLFPAALTHSLVNRKAKRISILYGLDLVYSNRKGFGPFVYGFILKFIASIRKIFFKIVTISRSTQSIAISKGFDNTLIIVPALPNQGFTSTLPNIFTKPDKYSASEQPIFYFGRLIPRKGALWFAKEVLPNLPDEVSFFVSGTINDPAYAEELFSCPKVVYLGTIPGNEIVNYIRYSSLVVMPNIKIPGSTDREGFGLVAVEASSVGCRLIASDLEGLSDAVKEGVTGFQVTPNDPKKWIDKIRELLSQSQKEKEEWIRSSSNATREIYSQSLLVRKFSDLLEFKSNQK
ncbi:glycosyltransferase family 4 protein [Leptospira licerasiae]|uniref:glycosyltransferase family 4 protein n=1 Tax=Leptospira licerasiae TaxID=447106 RepID=UPI0010829177|nr:glycosyltransferase family 4 protein [Leptospira licerasiae]TGM89808.1 glycosyltransferase [Leptospira licerasiae]